LKKKRKEKIKTQTNLTSKITKTKEKKITFFSSTVLSSSKKKIEPFFHELFHSARNFGPQRLLAVNNI